MITAYKKGSDYMETYFLLTAIAMLILVMIYDIRSSLKLIDAINHKPTLTSFYKHGDGKVIISQLNRGGR